MKTSLSPGAERALLGASVVLAVVVRWSRHLSLDPPPIEPTLFARPLLRPPLLDLITVPFPDREWLVLFLSAGAVLVTAALVRRGLGAVGGVVAAILAAVCPALVHAGSLWIPQSLVVFVVPALALVLLRALDGELGVLPVASLGLLALASDWSAWPPVLAWLGWLTVLRPGWMSADQARPAARGLGLACLLAAPAYTTLVLGHPGLQADLGVHGLPLGADALKALVGAVAAPWLGAARSQPMLLQGLTAAAVVAAMTFGARKAAATHQHPWGGVLLVGSAGAFVPALSAHPWLALGADKHVWYMSPFVLALGLAALWPVGRTPVLAVLLFLAGCAGDDADGDGWPDAEDCAADDRRIHPGARDLWDGVDNDCDGDVDRSDDYLFARDEEPNDTTLGGCFAPEGQDLGRLPAPGMLTEVLGRIDEVVPESYEEGDFDCFAFRAGPDSKDHRVQITLSWDDPDSDLDVALWGLFEGEQAGFIQGTSPGPGPETHLSSGAFEEGEPLWLWVAGYDGPPTDYRLEIILR